MKKFSLSLLAAGMMAAAGFAQADAIFHPDGRVVELGETGGARLAMDNAMNTSVLGAGPATTTATVTTVTAPRAAMSR